MNLSLSLESPKFYSVALSFPLIVFVTSLTVHKGTYQTYTCTCCTMSKSQSQKQSKKSTNFETTNQTSNKKVRSGPSGSP